VQQILEHINLYTLEILASIEDSASKKYFQRMTFEEKYFQVYDINYSGEPTRPKYLKNSKRLRN